MAKQMVVKMSVNHGNSYLVHIIADTSRWHQYKQDQKKKFAESGWEVLYETSHYLTLKRENDKMTFTFDMVEVYE